MNVPCITYRTFMNHQSQYMFPAVNKIWENERDKLLQEILSHPQPSIEVAGDGRADSPGHSKISIWVILPHGFTDFQNYYH